MTLRQGRRLTTCVASDPAVCATALAVLAMSGLAGCTDSGGSGAAWFVEESADRGIDYRHVSGFSGRHLLPEITGSGAALADLDGDGDLDVYIVQSGKGLVAAAVQRNRLYFNQGGGTFVPATDPGDAGDLGYGMGVATGDYDNDDDIDLYVTNVGANVLLRNDGRGRFEDVTAEAGVGDDRWGTSAAFLDLDGDGDLDLFVANYINWNIATEITCYIAGLLTYCPPSNYSSPAPDRLYRNNGDGTFTDVSAQAGLNQVYGNGFGVVSADFDDDGRYDVYVANDMMPNQLWLNRGDLRFDDEAMIWSCAVDEYGSPRAGMGVTSDDIDNDGDADIIVVNLRGETDSVFRNEGGWFRESTDEVGLAISSRRYTRFGVVLADFDNDGHLDLYHANGAVGPGEVRDGDIFREPNVVFRGTADGRFAEVLPVGGTSAALVHTSRGLAVGDVDDDGGLDLLVVNRDAPPYLLMNRVQERGNWIRFRVRTSQGRDAHGALVSGDVGGRRVQRGVQPEGSYLSANDPRPHFGLGAETVVRDVTVRWTDGRTEAFGDFEAGGVIELREGRGVAMDP